MDPKNEPPKIPSFKPAKKGEKKAGGIIPKTTGGPGVKLPGFGKNIKVRGLSGGATVIERLKRLRKKDLAFIAAGLSVLMMAPVAEHFLMSPESEQGTLKQGFSTTGEGTLFPDGTSVYEAGTGGFSPGALYGQGTDVITPLNVRDPSALVMGPGAAQKPSAGATAPTPKKSKGSWKDALAQAASAGAKQGIKKSRKLPVPSKKMSGALRGLNALAGGRSGASAKLSPLSASNVPNTARGSNALTHSRAAPGYRGAARRSNQAGTGLDSLKAAGNRQADIFNKGSSAANSLDTASSEQMPQDGGAGYGRGGSHDGKPGKNPGSSPNQPRPSVGESLALLRAKLEMKKAVALKWKKKEWNEFGKKKYMQTKMMDLGFEMMKGVLVEPLSDLTKKVLGEMFPSGGSAPGIVVCQQGPKLKPVFHSMGNGWKCADSLHAGQYKSDGSVIDKIDCPGGCYQTKSGGTTTGDDQHQIDRASDYVNRGGYKNELRQALKDCTPANNCPTEVRAALSQLDQANEQTVIMAKRYVDARREYRLAFKSMETITEPNQGLLKKSNDAIASAAGKLGDSLGDAKSASSVMGVGEQAKQRLEALKGQPETMTGQAFKQIQLDTQSNGEAMMKAAVDQAEGAVKPALDNVQPINKTSQDAKTALDNAAKAVRDGHAAGKDAYENLGSAYGSFKDLPKDWVDNGKGGGLQPVYRKVNAKYKEYDTKLEIQGGKGGEDSGTPNGQARQVYDQGVVPAIEAKDAALQSLGRDVVPKAQPIPETSTWDTVTQAGPNGGDPVAVQNPTLNQKVDNALGELGTAAAENGSGELGGLAGASKTFVDDKLTPAVQAHGKAHNGVRLKRMSVAGAS